MADRWLKANCLLASAAAFWLAALSPVPPIAKGISYSLALVAAVQLIGESRRLIAQDARRSRSSWIAIALHLPMSKISHFLSLMSRNDSPAKRDANGSRRGLESNPDVQHSYHSSLGLLSRIKLLWLSCIHKLGCCECAVFSPMSPEVTASGFALRVN